ncbi:hypothetical protein MTO96_029552 [Rhipicephalus appendiculatus]
MTQTAAKLNASGMGGKHGTKECFRKRSGVAAARGFATVNGKPPQQQADKQNRPAQRAGVVIGPPSLETQNPAPVAQEGGQITGTVRGVKEKEVGSDVTSSPAPQAVLPEGSQDWNSTITEGDFTVGSRSDPSSAENSCDSWPEQQSGGEEQDVPKNACSAPLRQMGACFCSISTYPPSESGLLTSTPKSRGRIRTLSSKTCTNSCWSPYLMYSSEILTLRRLTETSGAQARAGGRTMPRSWSRFSDT